jgi:hypothetical protein
VFFSCQNEPVFKNNIESEEVNEGGDEEIRDAIFAENHFGEEVFIDLIGQALDSNGAFVSGVQIEVGNNSILTDNEGFFVLHNISTLRNFTYVKAKKEGYINASHSFVPVIEAANRIKIVLLANEVLSTVSSGVSSEVELDNGVKIEFSGDFIDSNGATYNGDVNISLNYLEPNLESTYSIMPGMLFGQREDDSPSGLVSFGMVSVNLFSPEGENLNISETATVTFPIVSSSINPPQEIELWYFDENVGYWKEEGLANKVGNNYIAEVSHFTWWNCDYPEPGDWACININNQYSNSGDYFIELSTSGGNLIYTGGTALANSNFCNYFPLEPFNLKIFGLCNNELLYDDMIDISSSNLIEIQLNLSPNFINTSLQGLFLNCNSEPIQNGYALFYSDTTTYSDFEYMPLINGEINYDFTYCDGELVNYIRVIDIDAATVNVIDVNLSAPLIDLGSVEPCNSNSGLTYTGDVLLTSQQEVDDFALFEYSNIDGDFIIGEEPANFTVVDLNGLTSLQTVSGNLYIQSNYSLTSLSGLENLVTVGGEFRIVDNDNLELFTMNNLNSVGSILIHDNHDLISLTGLNNIQEVGGRFTVRSNASLETIVGANFSNVDGDITIQQNANLTSLNGFNIANTNGNIYILYNNLLTDLCAITSLFSSSSFTSDVTINNNGYNPSVQNIIDGDCSQ